MSDPVTNELLHYTEKPETFVCINSEIELISGLVLLNDVDIKYTITFSVSNRLVTVSIVVCTYLPQKSSQLFKVYPHNEKKEVSNIVEK